MHRPVAQICEPDGVLCIVALQEVAVAWIVVVFRLLLCESTRCLAMCRLTARIIQALQLLPARLAGQLPLPSAVIRPAAAVQRISTPRMLRLLPSCSGRLLCPLPRPGLSGMVALPQDIFLAICSVRAAMLARRTVQRR